MGILIPIFRIVVVLSLILGLANLSVFFVDIFVDIGKTTPWSIVAGLACIGFFFYLRPIVFHPEFKNKLDKFPERREDNGLAN